MTGQNPDEITIMRCSHVPNAVDGDEVNWNAIYEERPKTTAGAVKTVDFVLFLLLTSFACLRCPNCLPVGIRPFLAFRTAPIDSGPGCGCLWSFKNVTNRRDSRKKQ